MGGFTAICSISGDWLLTWLGIEEVTSLGNRTAGISLGFFIFAP